MGQQKHVTSEAIIGFADDLDQEVRPQITTTHGVIDECEIAQPKFGLLGIPLELGYSKVMQDFHTFLDTFDQKLQEIGSLLRTNVAPAWLEAENNNTVRYGDA